MNKTLRILFVITMLVSLATISIADNLEDAHIASESGDFKKAHQLWLVEAQKGSAAAQIGLGTLYTKGQGVPQNEKEAFKWFHMAAAQGEAKAQSYLGFLYANGIGVSQDDKEAAKWFHLAAVQGDAKAQFSLGVMYDVGRGLTQNDIVACAWYILAAKNGKVDAQNHLETTRARMSPDQIKMSQQIAEQLLAELGK